MDAAWRSLVQDNLPAPMTCKVDRGLRRPKSLASINLNTPDIRAGSTDRVRESPEMRRRVTRAERAAIVRLYEAGLATRAVAERLVVSKTCVLKILKAEGVSMRPRGNPGHSRQ